MYRKREKQFISFLERNKIVTPFTTNIKQNSKIESMQDLFELYTDSKTWFYSAFDWGTSEQGFDYWSRFNKKWLESLS